MPSTSPDAIVQQAADLSQDHDQAAAKEKLIGLVGGDRHALEAARDQVAAHLHRRVDDFQATATLTLLNRALADIPIVDPLDWRVRWSNRIGSRKP
jgi:hypothetical protein